MGAACFLAAASGGTVVAGGRDEGNGALADGVGARGVDAVPGSGVMMLTGGVEAELGKSALVGLPVGIDDPSAATGVVAAGAFHDGE